MIGQLRAFFADPARQALGWSALGICGIAFAAIGLWMLTSTGPAPRSPVRAEALSTPTPTASPTARATATPSPTASPTPPPSPSPSPTPTSAPVQRPVSQREPSSGGSDEPTPIPPTPTPPPVVAGGPYCPTVTSTAPPNSVIGLVNAPAGTSVGLAFDGVVGPVVQTSATGGYRVDYGAAGSDCANHAGAAISVLYNGTLYPTGRTVGQDPGAPVRFDIPAN